MNPKKALRSASALALKVPLCSALLLISTLADAHRRAPDFRRAWVCSSASDTGSIITSIMREFDREGKQLSTSVQWFLNGFDGDRLSVSAVLAAEGRRDPPLRRGEILATWSGFPQWDERRPWTAVLHRSGEAPAPIVGKPAFEYSGGLLGMLIPWRRVRALSAETGKARLSLVDREGRIIRSAEIDLRKIEEALARTRSGLTESRRKAADFEQQCHAITEWLTF